YIHEGRNAERFAENFKEDPGVLVPKVFWEVTTREVITLADVQAIKITDYKAIEQAGIPRADVADRLFNVYLKQVLEDRFFHADPHPGNLFVEPLETAEGAEPSWRLVFVDFGMAGEISTQVMEGLREVVIALGTADAARMVQADRKLNFLLPSADLVLLERAYQRLFERFSGKSTLDMMKMHGQEAEAFYDEFSQLIYELPFQLPENMILLGRCFSILSGICTGLDPAFNIWTSAGPYTTRLMDMQGERGLEFWLKEILDTLLVTVSLPRKVEGLIRHIESGKLEVSFTSLEQKITQLERSQWRFAEAILFSVFFFAAVQLYLAEQVGLAAIPAAFAI
ncbi:MAG: AarF/UbiB family protein, partial [Anaerolineaceae bacterium]